MMSLQSQREKFERFDIDYINAKIDANGKRIKAADEPTQENVDLATAAQERKAAKCREFRNWCAQLRDGIRRMLDDPAQASTDPALWQELHDDLAKKLPLLAAECPEAADPQARGTS